MRFERNIMAYEDVPQRLLDGESVPRSEIIGYNAPMTRFQTDLYLFYFVLLGMMEKVFEDETVKYRITPFGQQMRQDIVIRIEGDCPECPECP